MFARRNPYCLLSRRRISFVIGVGVTSMPACDFKDVH